MSWEIALVLGLLGTAFALMYVGNSLSEEHKLMKFFLLFVGLFMLVSNFGLSEHIIDANNSTITNTTLLLSQTANIYGNFLIVVRVSLLYFVLYLLWRLIGGRRAKKREVEDE